MKQITLSIILVCLSLATTHAQVVPIPNSTFKAYLVGNSSINTNGDNEIQLIEAFSFNGKIDISSLGISDLSGLEYFLSLTELDCSINGLTSLDISSNTNLTHLKCANNPLDSIDISQQTGLTHFDCSWCFLPSIDVSQNTALTHLNCRINNFSSLDVRPNTALVSLKCDNNSLDSLDVSNNIHLTELDCSGNPLTSLDVSMNTALTKLGCSFNQLSTLDLSSNTMLNDLYCSHNVLTALDVHHNPLLKNLDLRHNQLTSLDLSSNTNLRYLNASHNQLTALDLVYNTSLNSLLCNNNQLSSLNVQNGNNHNFYTPQNHFKATSNPNLSCIQVDDPVHSSANWLNIDSTASFSSNCFTHTTAPMADLQILKTFPNPTTGIVQISLGKQYDKLNLEVTNLAGQLILSKTIFHTQELVLDLNQPNGVYFIHLQTHQYKKTLKVVKESRL